MIRHEVLITERLSVSESTEALLWFPSEHGHYEISRRNPKLRSSVRFFFANAFKNPDQKDRKMSIPLAYRKYPVKRMWILANLKSKLYRVKLSRQQGTVECTITANRDQKVHFNSSRF